MPSANSPAEGRELSLPEDVREVPLGVAFFDLSRFGEWASAEADLRVASFFQGFYGLCAACLEPAGVRIVKFIGDAALVVFPPERAEDAVLALCDLSREAREAGRAVGFDTHLNVNVHVGPVVAGTFGPAGLARFDVLGKTVNVAARLGRRGVTLSAEAFRCLSPEGRTRFEKQQPAATYRWTGPR